MGTDSREIKMIYNPVLNFVYRANKAGNASVDIISKATQYYKPDILLKAKEIIWPMAGKTTRVSERVKALDIVTDLIGAVRQCDEKKIALLKFVIYEPDEEPIIPGEVTATLTRKLNEVCSSVEDLKQHITTLKSQTSFVPQVPSVTSQPKPTYSVILKQPAKGLVKPDDRKGYIESLADAACCSHIMDLKPLQKEWRIVLDDKDAATTLANAVKDAKLKSPSCFGIIRHIPDDIEDSDLCGLIQNCVKAERIRKTRSFKLLFDSKMHLLKAMENPVTFGYEKHRIQDYKFLPMRCYNCQQFGHAAQTCKNDTKCSRCAACHKNSKEDPCNNDVKCALCSSADHPCFSIKCPVAMKIMASK
jgi:hypothetical protein